MRGWQRGAAALAVVMGLALGPAVGPAVAQGLPPLIDREILFGDPDIANPQLSPDGSRIAFLRPFNGVRNVWVKKIDQPFSEAKPVTAEVTRPIAGYLWSRDSKYILYVRDQGGDENFNVYAVNPADAPAEGAQVPPSRNLTQLPKVRAQLIAVPKSEPDVIYIGLNDRDPAWHDLYRLRISTGERELVRQNTERFTGHVFDRKDQLRLVTRSADNGDTEILRVDPQGMTKIYSCSILEYCSIAGFHPDGRRVYLITNHGEPDLAQVELLDVQTGKTELVETDPEKRVDITNLIISDVSYELLGTVYVDARARIYWRNDKARADYEFLKSKFPQGDILFVSNTADESKVLVVVRGDTEPGDYHLFERQTRKLTPQFRLFDTLPRESLTTVQPIEYASSDGMKIPAYLSLPKGVPGKNLPLLVMPHGGPWARDTWGYSPYTQLFTNRGFAVLHPNFRGSTGYGKRFLNAGNNQWGQLMQDDITWGVKHLVQSGIADPKRVVIMGGSYGGYATLAGLAFTPDLYAAGVSYVGPSNLITLLNSIPPYWEAMRKFLYARVADPGTPEGRAMLERQSPLNSASKIKAPLMVIQGANDPRVKQHESDQIVVALRDRNFPVEYYVAPDEGHGFAKPVNNIAVLAAAERFFARHVSGVRYQESMTEEVARRLAELTVDPKSVQLPTKTDGAMPEKSTLAPTQ
jgi:dipeptidyl aminopeptidase/acylaminoacyl peptidase